VGKGGYGTLRGPEGHPRILPRHIRALCFRSALRPESAARGRRRLRPSQVTPSSCLAQWAIREKRCGGPISTRRNTSELLASECTKARNLPPFSTLLSSRGGPGAVRLTSGQIAGVLQPIAADPGLICSRAIGIWLHLPSTSVGAGSAEWSYRCGRCG
jgi:hypothetical protein